MKYQKERQKQNKNHFEQRTTKMTKKKTSGCSVIYRMRIFKLIQSHFAINWTYELHSLCNAISLLRLFVP